MAQSTYSLDFLTLPIDEAFEARSILIGPPADLKIRLGSMPQTLERIQSAQMFAAQSTKEETVWRSAAFLRAALADYSSIFEMQTADSPTTVAFKLQNTMNPLLHLLDLMRHQNIHVKTVTTMPHTVDAQWDNQEFEMKVSVISNLSVSDLAALRNGRKYALADLVRVVDWFTMHQNIWGAGDLITLGTNILAKDICSHFNL